MWRLLSKNSKTCWQKLCAATPMLVSNCLSLVLFKDDTEAISKAVVFLCCIWVSSAKVLAFCLNRGLLARPLTTIQIAAMYLLPITLCNQSPGWLPWTSPVDASHCFNCFCTHNPLIAANSISQLSKFVPHRSKKPGATAIGFVIKLTSLITAANILVLRGKDLSPLCTHILYGIVSLIPSLLSNRL